MKMIPRVLILMSVYNGGKYLAVQLESIVRQEGVDVSLYIRDDGSDDDSETIIREYAKKIPIAYCRESNVGAAGSFMRLIELAEDEYDYYAFADQDDYWKSDKLSVAISKLMSKDERPAIYYSNVERVGKNLEKIQDPYKKHYHTEKFPDVLILAQAPGCTMVFNKRLFTLLKRHIPSQVHMHDHWVLQVCAAVGGMVVYDAEPHILYRQHTDNVMAGLKKMKYNPVQLFQYRIQKLFDFTYKPAVVAVELKAGYDDLVDDRNRRIIQLFVDAPKCLKYRIYMLLTNKISTPYWEHNVRWKFRILLNKL